MTNEHFRAFSFVTRIISVEKGKSIRGSYVIPPDIDAFPGSLVSEAIGQLAAWSAMAAFDFKFRPVAGLAGKIELLGAVRPGQTLELTADLESVEEDAAAYGGTACVDGVPVIRVQHCVGPMLPVEDFDDPQAVRARFELLCRQGAEPGGFRGLPNFALEKISGENGKTKSATIQVPAAAPFFADHFPRRPVFPGTLLMHLNLELAAALATEIPPPDGAWKLRGISDVKLRAFTPPGEILQCEAVLSGNSGGALCASVETRKGGRTVGSAKVFLSSEAGS